jgi:ATP-dependent Clp protease protease subunit
VKTWFKFENAANDPSAVDIHIIDFIGGWLDDAANRYWGEEIGVTARAFVAQLAQLPDSVKALRVHINSPGGDVMGGVNIANALREQQLSKGRTVETFVDGIAASIASVIAMAGSKIHMGDNALMMVHNPYGLAVGNAAEMRKTADALDAIRGQIVATYRWHSTLDDDAIVALLDAETWMDADEAIAQGFATHKVEGLHAAAALDARAIARMAIPDKFRARVEALVKPADPAPMPVPEPQAADPGEVLALCRQAQVLDLAESLVTSKATMADVQHRIAAAQQTRQAAQARADAIRALCGTAKLPELAESYVTGGMAVDAVKTQLTTLTARIAGADIDGALPPNHGQQPKARINVSQVYADLNKQPKKE